jgi:putative N6-adenine-specific DNA methylase
MTKNNVRVAGLTDFIEVKKEDFVAPGEISEPVQLIMNPPYGERLKVDDIEALYSGIGTTLKHRFPGSTAWLYTANPEALQSVGLKADKKITLFNAALEGKFMKYQLFSGTRKAFVTS